LFVVRARAIKPDFSLNHENGRDVAGICCRLDGLPLAIELAAVQVKFLPPAAVLRRLDRRLQLLTRGAQDLPARHRTLREALGWSFSLLQPAEQVLFRRLALFVGGATLDAVEAVCNSSGDLPVDLLDGMFSLVDKNLVRKEDQPDGETRFKMLETVREYAVEQLANSGDLDSVQQRYAACFLALVERAEPELQGEMRESWLDRLEREHDNLRAVLKWARESGEVELGLRMAGALWRFWRGRGHWNEGRAWLDGLLAESGPVSPSTRAKGVTGAGLLAWYQGDYGRTDTLCREGLVLYRALDDKHGMAESLQTLGMVAWLLGDYQQAAAHHSEALALRKELGDQVGIASSLGSLGVVARYQGDYDRAVALYEESLSLRRAARDKVGIALSLLTLGVVAVHRGDPHRARAMLEESQSLFQEVADAQGLANVKKSLGDLARYQGDLDRAVATYVESLILSIDPNNRRGIAQAFQGLAGVATARRRFVQAARLFGAAEKARRAIGFALPLDERKEHDRDVAKVRAALGPEALAEAWAAGEAMATQQAVEYALKAAQPARATTTLSTGAGSRETRNPLTSRQLEVAEFIARGFTNRQIATEMTITERTAENHVQHILDKLGFTSRAQIAGWAVERRLRSTSARSPQ
jgi:non-specific serine/threonine protein kinase